MLNIVWEKLLAAMKSGSLPANPAATDSLKKALAGLTLRMPEGSETGHASFAGKQFLFGTNSLNLDSLEFAENSGGPELRMKVNGKSYALRAGFKKWVKGQAAFGTMTEQPVAVSGAWTQDGVYTARLCFYETPAYITLKLSPAGENLKMESEYNVAFENPKQDLIGTAD